MNTSCILLSFAKSDESPHTASRIALFQHSPSIQRQAVLFRNSAFPDSGPPPEDFLAMDRLAFRNGPPPGSHSAGAKV